MFGLSGLVVTLALVTGHPVTAEPVEPGSPVVFLQGFVRGTPQIVVEIRQDGTWSTMTGPGGRISAAEVAELQALAAKTDTTVRRLEGSCPPVANQSQWVNIGLKRVSWGACQAPHATVFKLIELAESLTTRRPPEELIKLKRHHSGQPEDTTETVVVARSGAWKTHNASGILTSNEVAELIKLVDAALIEAPPTPMAPYCRSGYLHHLEIPGRGEVRWAPPCSEPSDTLGAVLARVYDLVKWKK